jgi:hypothetical protein
MLHLRAGMPGTGGPKNNELQRKTTLPALRSQMIFSLEPFSEDSIGNQYTLSSFCVAPLF